MGMRADFCAIVSAKTGACQEDCSYCAQSARSKTQTRATPLIGREEVLEKARGAKGSGARRFCIVTSGRASRDSELESIAGYVSAVRDEGLLPCATLGLLGMDELSMLKQAGLNRYHHNLETSRRYFPQICSTHTYEQKIETILAAKDAGLSVCSGGIFGLGESWADRIEMANELRALEVNSVPINFLVPIEGTPLGDREKLKPLEALRIVSLYRLMLPDRQIRICGGRLQTLGEFNSMSFMAGADGLLTGDCLTVAGCSPEADIRLASQYGLDL
ncbi:MAG: biotin synthase BioB, partial [Thermodesulfovibrionales bacterium]|nr:biotin synthase BioB [Thermodesulfovibrionales bacterium]